MESVKAAESGFSLLETVIATMLVGMLISGLVITWQFVDSRQFLLDQYSQNKEALETAYEITTRALIGEAVSSTVLLINGGQGIQYQSTDGSIWSFTKDGRDFKRIHRTATMVESETLLKATCETVLFTKTGSKVAITLRVTTPSGWTQSDDLLINGSVYPRN
jgi:type II secretory pathway pseudopilin PulG